MSTPLIWIGIPIGFGLLLLAIPKRRRISASVASLLSLLLAILAFIFPAEHVLILGGQRYEFATSLAWLGRSLTIAKADLTLVGLLFSLNFMWNAFSNRFKTSMYFNSLSLVITALWVAVMALDPFLYSAVLVQLIVMVSVPLLSPRGQAAGPGLLRYLVMQSLAVPFILLSGWMLSGIATAPSVNPLIIRAAMMIMVGFALWLAVFPLHTWVTMLGQESHPWVLSFLMTMRQTTVLVYLLGFFDRYAWLRTMPNIDAMLQILGVVLVALGGLLCAFQSDLRRVFAYIFVAETGYAILALGLRSQGALPFLAMSFVPRALFYWLWGYTLSVHRDQLNQASALFTDLQGFFRRQAPLSMAWVFTLLGVSGLPLLAYFPPKRSLWLLSGSLDLGLTLGLVIGVGGSLLFVMRLLRTLTKNSETDQAPLRVPVMVLVTLALVGALALAIGFLPQVFLNPMQAILSPFTQLMGLP